MFYTLKYIDLKPGSVNHRALHLLSINQSYGYIYIYTKTSDYLQAIYIYTKTSDYLQALIWVSYRLGFFIVSLIIHLRCGERYDQTCQRSFHPDL